MVSRLEYLVQQPKPLERLAIDQIGQWIISSGMALSENPDEAKADAMITKQIPVIRKYLSKLPTIYHNPLSIVVTLALNNIEKNDEIKYTRKMLIGRMIETVFSEYLTTLSLCSQIFYGSLAQGYLLSSLTDLTFAPTSLSCTDNIESDTINFLKGLHNLKYLNLSYCSGICSINKIMRCISENCKQIEVLNLCYLECLNDDSMEILTQLENLKRIDVRETGVSVVGVEKLLRAYRDIEYILSDGNELALALEKIDKETPGMQFGLIYYENCQETTLDQMLLIVKMCSTLQKLSLTKHDSRSFIEALEGLKNLRKLELYNYEFKKDNLQQFFEEKGYNLVHLYLEDVDEIDLEALRCISRTCPTLEILSLEDCRFGERVAPPGYIMFQGKPPPKGPLFQCLKTLSLTRLGGGQWLPIDEQIYYLMSSCPNVRYICTSRIPVTDEMMLKVMERNPFNCLEVLELRNQNKLSPTVLEKIVQHCVNLSKVAVTNPTVAYEARRHSLNTPSIYSIL